MHGSGNGTGSGFLTVLSEEKPIFSEMTPRELYRKAEAIASSWSDCLKTREGLGESLVDEDGLPGEKRRSDFLGEAHRLRRRPNALADLRVLVENNYDMVKRAMVFIQLEVEVGEIAARWNALREDAVKVRQEDCLPNAGTLSPERLKEAVKTVKVHCGSVDILPWCRLRFVEAGAR
jgi:hypothetical protein